MSKSSAKWSLITASGLVFSSVLLSAKAADNSKPPTFDKLVEIAKDHLRANAPGYKDDPAQSPRVTKYSDRWEITWVLPPMHNGGAPTVVLDRNSLQVKTFWREQ